jgi:hypothetical protein
MQSMGEAELIIEQILAANTKAKAKAIIARFIVCDDEGPTKWTRDARFVWERAYRAL